MQDLAARKCVACEGGAAPLSRIEAEVLLKQLDRWVLSDDASSISKRFSFPDFATALSFVDEVGAVAESEGHHPDIAFGWGKADITLTTHAIGGLSENDLIVAAKVDRIRML